MDSHQRFQNCLNYSTGLNVPIDYLACPDVDRRLREHYNAENETQLLDALGADFYYLSCRDISQNESSRHIYKGPALETTETERICPFGIRWRRKSYDSKFAVDEAIEGPLRNVQTEQQILDHPWPKPVDFDFSPFHAECENNQNRVIVGGFWSGILGDCYRMIGFEHFLLMIAMNPALMQTLVNRMTDFYLEMNDKLFTELPGKIDIWFFGNDFGQQGGLLFSKQMFEDFFLENVRKLAAHARSHGVHVMMHSCGAIREIIPMLIDAGVEILDPIQVTAAGMEPESLVRDFGGKIVFHGGIDTQQILPSGTPDDVARTSEQMIRTLTQNSGYIFAPSQILDADIPTQNIAAMYETAQNLRKS